MNLNTTAAPHIHGKNSTAATMQKVLVALIPTLIMGIYVFGARALLVALVSVATSVAAEALLRVLTRKPQTVMDCSAAVTGLLLALTLPVNVPYWVAAVGGVFAIVVVKGLGGGLGPAAHWRSVTVLHTDSGLADGLSTALFTLPREEGQALLDHYGAEAMWVDQAGEMTYSDGFSDYIRT